MRFKDDGFLSLSKLPDPSKLKGVDSSTDRIESAIRNGERVVLIGDYDVDGVVSTTIMKLLFNEIGIELDWIIPNRFKDGYGLSKNIIPQIRDYDLAITVDNGISAVEASLLCQEYGIDLIITDHHAIPKELPVAYSIVNPKQEDCQFPYSDICGAQIAWYLIASLNRKLGLGLDIKKYLELVAIAIVADIMPLKHINRAMVNSGIGLLENSNRPAILAFKELSNKTVITSDDIAYSIAPLLNSAGRMEDAKYSVEFLLSSNIDEARERLKRLVIFNEKRKAIERSITDKALALADPKDKIIVVVGEDWHEGVVGIVSARVGRVHKKPTIILTKGENGELKGSGRSFDVCDLFKIASKSKRLFSRFGGHHSAIGLTIPTENLEEFKRELQINYMAEEYGESIIDHDILGELDFRYIDQNLIGVLNRYEPYGHENSRPKFITRGVKVQDVKNIGKDKEHRRFRLSKSGVTINGVLFKTKESFHNGQIIDIIYTINENHFNGKTTIQIMIDEVC